MTRLLKRPAEKGFTLIELMIVVAIIGILAAIAIPKMADLIRKSNEGATKGNLGAIRGALSIYYGEQEGTYPRDTLSSLTTNARYIASIPVAKTPPFHGNSSTVAAGTAANNAGGWTYNNDSTNNSWGTVLVNCTDTDTKSSNWTSY